MTTVQGPARGGPRTPAATGRQRVFPTRGRGRRQKRWFGPRVGLPASSLRRRRAAAFSQGAAESLILAGSRVAHFSRVAESRVAAPRLGATRPTGAQPCFSQGENANTAFPPCSPSPWLARVLPAAACRRREDAAGRTRAAAPRSGGGAFAAAATAVADESRRRGANRRLLGGRSGWLVQSRGGPGLPPGAASAPRPPATDAGQK